MEEEEMYKFIAWSLKDMLDDEEPMSNCCGFPFTEPGWPDSDLCSSCGEHADIEEDDSDEE